LILIGSFVRLEIAQQIKSMRTKNTQQGGLCYVVLCHKWTKYFS